MAQKGEDEMIDVILDDDDDDDKSRQQAPLDDDDDDDDDASASGESNDDKGMADDPINDESTGEETSEEREAIRERRRQERQERKRHQREREESLRRELNSRDETISQMQTRLEAIERRNAGGEMAQLQQAKKAIEKQHQFYKEQIRLGTESQNGEAVAEATERLLDLRVKAQEIDRIEKAVSNQRQAAPPMNPKVLTNTKSWAEKNPWYDIRGRDQDSRVVMMLDQTLAEEGWNPQTQGYWDELDSRVKKYLPHRARRDNITTEKKPKSVVASSGRETSSKGSSTFRLSSERVKALKDAGKWEDPVERNKMIKQYRDYDRNNANEGAR